MTKYIIDGRRIEVDTPVGRFLAKIPREEPVFFDNCAAHPIHPGNKEEMLVSIPYTQRPIDALKDGAGRLSCLLDLFTESENLLTITNMGEEFLKTNEAIYHFMLQEQNVARRQVYRRILERRDDFFDFLTRPEGLANSKNNMLDEDFERMVQLSGEIEELFDEEEGHTKNYVDTKLVGAAMIYSPCYMFSHDKPVMRTFSRVSLSHGEDKNGIIDEQRRDVFSVEDYLRIAG